MHPKNSNLQKLDNSILISSPSRPAFPRSEENITLTEEAIKAILPKTLLT